MRAPTLTAGSLTLDAPSPDDAEAWADAQDEECARWFDWPGRPTVERCRAHLESVAADANPAQAVWAIREDGHLLGGIDLKPCGHGWNVAYFVAPAARGRGVATQALEAVTTWARETDRLPVVTAVHVDNVASQRVLAKGGFVRTGTGPSEEGPHDDHFFQWRP